MHDVHEREGAPVERSVEAHGAAPNAATTSSAPSSRSSAERPLDRRARFGLARRAGRARAERPPRRRTAERAGSPRRRRRARRARAHTRAARAARAAHPARSTAGPSSVGDQSGAMAHRRYQSASRIAAQLRARSERRRFEVVGRYRSVGSRAPGQRLAPMRLGIRLQLLLALGSLLVLAFVPLFFAVASLTRATMALGARGERAGARARDRRARHRRARERGPTRISRRCSRRSSGRTASPRSASTTRRARSSRARRRERGGGGAARVSGARAPSASPPVQTARGARGARRRARRSRRPRGRGRASLVRTDSPTDARPRRSLRLVALYTGVVALALLVFAYFAMTRLVVQPIDAALARRAPRRRGRAPPRRAPRAARASSSSSARASRG